ncbi:MAG: hypothetical protein EHM67_00030 [Hyphomicrobiaceae bacterium]|jgi:hypothetical protein|nr:MAG: hypothetical protein EHM67_00030 [Hyphomicrobiaceae bacterium]
MNALVTLTIADMTPAQIVDAYGIASAHAADAAKRKEELRLAILAFGDGAYDGSRYRATVATAPVSRISPDLVRELLSADDVALVTVAKPETRVRCVARH